MGEQVYGKGDPAPNVAFSDQAFVHTMDDAKAKKLWPRPEPEAAPPKTAQNGTATAGPGTGTSTADDVEAGAGSETPAPGTFHAEGPLRQALADVFAAARDAGVGGFASVTIKLFSPADTWSFHQAAAALKGPATTCGLEASMSGEGVEEFEVLFRGSMTKANQVKSFLTPNLASAAEATLQGVYAFHYAADPLATDPGSEGSVGRPRSRSSAAGRPSSRPRPPPPEPDGSPPPAEPRETRTPAGNSAPPTPPARVCSSRSGVTASPERARPGVLPGGFRSPRSAAGPYRLMEPLLLKRLANLGLPAAGLKRGGSAAERVHERDAVSLALLFRALAPMRSIDRIRLVADGIDRLSPEEANTGWAWPCTAPARGGCSRRCGCC